MKKQLLLFTFLTFLSLPFSWAQSYNMLHQDPMGDETQTFAKDLRSVEYAIDETQDSLWLRFVFFDTIGGDFGLAIAFDTNLVTTDGKNWNGINTSMQYDTIIYLERNGFFETHIRSSTTLVNSIKEKDSVTIIINIPLSQLDNNGNFNMIAGSGSFDISTTGTTFDDIPDDSFVTVPLAPTSIQEYQKSIISLFPNPATDFIRLKMTKEIKGNLEIINTNGQIVQTISNNRFLIDVSGLQNGLYFVRHQKISSPKMMTKFQILR